MNEKLKIILEQCQQWEQDSENMAKLFEGNKMRTSQFSSEGMAQAYRNVIRLIEEAFLSTEP